MRIIAGECRNKALLSLEGEATRPTLNRVKEGMFSAVQMRLPGAKVLDLYAGSGQLGLEALSRGAALCHFVDSAKEALQVAQRNAKSVGLDARCRFVCAQAERFIAGCEENFDLILLDPPFETLEWEALLSKLEPRCNAQAQVLCETSAKEQLPKVVGALCLQKHYRYGSVCVWRYSLETDDLKTEK